MMEQKIETISPAIRLDIQLALADIEQKHDVKILYACESGSRAWGFSSTDSDYDVRFIYVHSLDWYLLLDRPRDVIEVPISDELDICGWELAKTLKLMRNSNPALMEWLNSPIVYQQDESSLAVLMTLANRYFSDMKARYHYLSMAKKNFYYYLQHDQVKLKKYFYALRPLLAVQWIEAGKGVPPMNFEQLVAGTVNEPKLLAEINQLLAIKRSVDEKKFCGRQEYIHQFLAKELDEAILRCDLSDNRTRSNQPLDDFLRHTILNK